MANADQIEAVDSQPIAVNFHYEAADFIASHHLYAVPTWHSWILPSLFISTPIAYAIFSGHSLAYIMRLTAGMVIPIALTALVFMFVYLPWVARRTFAKQPLAHLTMTVELRPEGIATKSARGSSTLLWQDFIRWRTNSKTILVYLSPRLYMHFPVRLAALGFRIDDLRVALLRELGPPR